jgi:isopentenyl diphosphate isomerase/L-lactate dehydrogenase-like FMN-dependent dehydrogenase
MLVQRAEQAGDKAIVLTVDTPLPAPKEWDLRNRYENPWIARWRVTMWAAPWLCARIPHRPGRKDGTRKARGRSREVLLHQLSI